VPTECLGVEAVGNEFVTVPGRREGTKPEIVPAAWCSHQLIAA